MTTPSSAPRRSGAWLVMLAQALPLALVAAAIWLARQTAAPLEPPATQALPTPASSAGSPWPAWTPAPAAAGPAPLMRLALLDTTIPTRARLTIQKYVVQKGDTVFGIAAKYNIKPDTILWGNPELVENVGLLRPGKELNILPIDGALRVVQAGDTLEKIAKVFHGKLDEIVTFAGNDLDLNDPQIKAGQPIIIPGGWRDTVQWSLPVVSRTTKGPGNSGEPGSCAGPFFGPMGTFTFVWPANNHYLSGWDFSPNTHPGIDIATALGAPIYASDSGVVVFSGWSTRGYGNLIIVDHGNGWQTAYAHLSQINVGCGAGVSQGQLIGLAGSTGNSTGAHLHFEMRSDQYGRVNPWLYLP